MSVFGGWISRDDKGDDKDDDKRKEMREKQRRLIDLQLEIRRKRKLRNKLRNEVNRLRMIHMDLVHSNDDEPTSIVNHPRIKEH